MLIGALQMNIIKCEKKKNLDIVERLTKNTEAELIVLPELFSTGYHLDTARLRELAEEIPVGDTTLRLIEIAKTVNSHFVGTIIEKECDHLYITAVLVGPSGYIGKHRKRHLTTHESDIFAPGNNSEVFDINGCKIGIVICFEGWFPESTRDLMLKGAQIICHSLLTTQQKTLDIMRVRAIENKVYMVMANSISTEMWNNEAVTFRGDSRVIDYNGNILINAGYEEKLILIAVDEKISANKCLDDCSDLISEVRTHNYF